MIENKFESMGRVTVGYFNALLLSLRLVTRNSAVVSTILNKGVPSLSLAFSVAAVFFNTPFESLMLSVFMGA
jgi:hypothetical protein